jgi:hypothetical protein
MAPTGQVKITCLMQSGFRGYYLPPDPDPESVELIFKPGEMKELPPEVVQWLMDTFPGCFEKGEPTAAAAVTKSAARKKSPVEVAGEAEAEEEADDLAGFDEEEVDEEDSSDGDEN